MNEKGGFKTHIIDGMQQLINLQVNQVFLYKFETALTQ